MKELDFMKKCWEKLTTFYLRSEFLCLVVIAIGLARAYPPLGAVYLSPHITALWMAIIFIFFLVGLGLKTEELQKAASFQRLYFNVLVPLFNFGVVSAVVFGFSRLAFLEIIGGTTTPRKALADGMVLCSCLPLTINMVVVLTSSSGGDEASAVFHAAFGNFIGVFISPALILGYLGTGVGDVNVWTVFVKLALRLVLPILIGQVLRNFSKTVIQFVKYYKQHLKKAQMYTLVYIVYTTYCRTFYDDEDDTNEFSAKISDILLMVVFQIFLLCTVMVVAWYLLKVLYSNEPTLRCMGLFGMTHKTVAMGIPLITAMYENNTNTDSIIGLYILPLLIWHSVQLVIGSLLAPYLLRFVESEKERLLKTTTSQQQRPNDGDDSKGLAVVLEQGEETELNNKTAVRERSISELSIDNDSKKAKGMG